MIIAAVRLLIALPLACLACNSRASAQADPAEVEAIARFVQAGDVAALEERFRGGRTSEELRLLAAAQTIRAAGARDDQSRQREFELAQVRYLAWIDFIERDSNADRLVRDIERGRARLALAEMILTRWAAPDLDEFEVMGDKSAGAPRLRELLLQARGRLSEAREILQPLADELRDADRKRDEDTVARYLIAGVYETLPRAASNVQYNLAWTNLQIGITDPRNLARRVEALSTAERVFDKLLLVEQPPETARRCRLGLAITQREQARHEEARRQFEQLLKSVAESDAALAARIRVEWAANEMKSDRFEEARRVLQPLVVQNPDKLPPDAADVRFYVNLAHLRYADSYLREAAGLEKTAGASSALAELLTRARQLRAAGLLKMNELASRGGSWPGIVRSHLAEISNLQADVETQDPVLLLFSARGLIEQERFRDALDLLAEALNRPNLPPELLGDLLFELGGCHYRLEEIRTAAEIFARLASECPAHPRAARALSYADSLWTLIAERSRDAADYSSLADVLFTLVRSFPEHEDRLDADWRLPAALQAAGRYREAAEQYGNFPSNRPQAPEARFRRVLCLRLACELERNGVSEEQRFERASSAARALEQFAEQALRDAARQVENDPSKASAPSTDLLGWSAAALISAAEMYVAEPLRNPTRALELLRDFERHYPRSIELGRMLAARVNALRALERYDEADRAIEQFLREASAEQAGGTLASLARGVQEELDRLEALHDRQAARRTATKAIPIFEKLEAWVRADSSREKYQDAARYGLARVYCAAGRYEAAEPRVRELLEKDARNGDFLRLYALVLTDRAEDAPQAELLSAAREAWGAILRDVALSQSSPERYGEARYRYLELMLREGRAADVENAIRQERIWRTDRPPTYWDDKIDELYERARSSMKP